MWVVFVCEVFFFLHTFFLRVTWAAKCFYDKPTCYFSTKDGVTYNTQTVTFEVNSHGLCPEIIAEVDISGEICDTGRINVTLLTTAISLLYSPRTGVFSKILRPLRQL